MLINFSKELTKTPLEQNKTHQLLSYLIKNHPRATVTVLMKLSYLIDLVSIKKTSSKISDFEYRRYTYGPFDKKIYEYLESLIQSEIINVENEYDSQNEYVIYNYNESNNGRKFNLLTDNEKGIVNEVLESVKGYGAKTLTEIAYKTKPMVALCATIGGSENINAVLNMNA